jgi:hypothetical protein
MVRDLLRSLGQPVAKEVLAALERARAVALTCAMSMPLRRLQSRHTPQKPPMSANTPSPGTFASEARGSENSLA